MKKTLTQTTTRTVDMCDWPGCEKHAVFAWPCFACRRDLCPEHADYFVASTQSETASNRLCPDCAALYRGGAEAIHRDVNHIRENTRKAVEAAHNEGDSLLADIFIDIKAAWEKKRKEPTP